MKKRRRETPWPPSWAESKPKLRVPGSKVDWATDWKPESQGQAATPGRESRRSKPRRNGRNVRRERHQPPALASGQGVSPSATGCKQWPVPFSRFEYQPVVPKRLNQFWLLLVNFWHAHRITDLSADHLRTRAAALILNFATGRHGRSVIRIVYLPVRLQPTGASHRTINLHVSIFGFEIGKVSDK